MNPDGPRDSRPYSPEQRKLLLFMDRSGLNAGICDEVMHDQYPWLPGWYASLGEDEIRTPLERLTEDECEAVMKAMRRMVRLLRPRRY